jgi:hypothetical protein
MTNTDSICAPATSLNSHRQRQIRAFKERSPAHIYASFGSDLREQQKTRGASRAADVRWREPWVYEVTGADRVDMRAYPVCWVRDGTVAVIPGGPYRWLGRSGAVAQHVCDLGEQVL